MSVTERLQAAFAHLSACPNARLIAVSKGQPLEKILEAYACGQRDFGENYAQELIEKSAELAVRGIRDIRWHFIGHLQTNKVKQLLPLVSSIHTIDSARLAQEISKRWTALGRAGALSVFAEVNVDREPSKSGVFPEDLAGLLTATKDLPGLDWAGLMCVPSREAGLSGEAFRALAKLERSSRPVTRGELSMGMSGDYEVALREGAGASRVWIRLGTGIFGERARRPG